jgi:NitT/TauT family transport system substrate-binding protein
MRAIGLASGVVALALAAGISAKAQNASDVIRLGVSGRPDQAALELALRRGYFEQEGLKVETVQGTTGQEMLPALATDKLQVASGSPNAGMFNALNRGIDIKIVADFAHVGKTDDRTVSMIVRSDLMESGAVKTVADLKGRIISWGPGPGQVTEFFYDHLFAKGGFTKADVAVRYINFSDMLAGMANKSLDGGFMIEPLVTVAEARKIARVFMLGSEIIPGSELSVVYYSPEFAKKKEQATKFMVAFLKGVRDYNDAFFHDKGKDAAIDVLIQHLSVKDKTIWQGSRQHIDVNGKINVADLKAQAAYFRKIGLVPGPMPDIDIHIDTSFAEAAVKRLGPYKP